jgi:o-succinylbenzoate synthase
MKAYFFKKTFQFKIPSGTSRGVLTEKLAWFIEIWQEDKPEIKGVGECSVIAGLTPEFLNAQDYELLVSDACRKIEFELHEISSDFILPESLKQLPSSILFGVETAIRDLYYGGNGLVFDNDFDKGLKRIPINGLIWMGRPEFLQQQIEEKVAHGYTCIKMKIGAINFEQEYEILKTIRSKYSSDQITLRVDANGAFNPDEAREKLKRLALLDIHSIEQPIKAGNWKDMTDLCKQYLLPIALDEELIGIKDFHQKENLLKTIQPQYIILKPSLHGGISGCQEWISLSESLHIPWWITSALESNIGLKAICQFTAEYDTNLPQGLGTGSLYTNNITSNLRIERGEIFTDQEVS